MFLDKHVEASIVLVKVERDVTHSMLKFSHGVSNLHGHCLVERVLLWFRELQAHGLWVHVFTRAFELLKRSSVTCMSA